MNFAKNTIKFICSYLIERYQYLQIEDKGSTLLSMFFGVPHKSILGPVLFNLYLGELADRTYSKTIQYVSSAHPVRIQYQHWKISTLGECAVEIQKDVERLLSWSQQNNLYSTVPNFNLFYFPRHDWALNTGLWKFSRFTPLKVRKTLAEALILSKINYCNVVYSQLPKYLINRLQQVQATTAGYVYGRYAKTLDVININWVPIEENIEMNTVKLAQKSLNDKLWPNYLKLALIELYDYQILDQ